MIIEGPKKVLLGHRMSASKTKQSEHADKASMDELQKEDAAKLQISAQTKEGVAPHSNSASVETFPTVFPQALALRPLPVSFVLGSGPGRGLTGRVEG